MNKLDKLLEENKALKAELQRSKAKSYITIKSFPGAVAGTIFEPVKFDHEGKPKFYQWGGFRLNRYWVEDNNEYFKQQ